eukprot:7380292-Prymnesium_polylepis.1
MTRPRTTSPSPSSRQNSRRSSAAHSADLAAAGSVWGPPPSSAKQWPARTDRPRFRHDIAPNAMGPAGL